MVAAAAAAAAAANKQGQDRSPRAPSEKISEDSGIVERLNTISQRDGSSSYSTLSSPLTLQSPTMDSQRFASLDGESSAYQAPPPPLHSLRKTSASSAVSSRPSSSSASFSAGTQSGRVSNDSNWSAHTAAQSPSLTPSTPKSKVSRSKILASSAVALDTSPPSLPLNTQAWPPRGGFVDVGAARSASPLPAGKSSIVMNTSTGSSILERKKRLASASGSNAFDDGLTDTSSVSSRSARTPINAVATDQASILSSTSNTSVGAPTPSHRRNRVDPTASPTAASVPNSPSHVSQGEVEIVHSNASPTSFKNRLFGLRKERRNDSASQDNDSGNNTTSTKFQVMSNTSLQPPGKEVDGSGGSLRVTSDNGNLRLPNDSPKHATARPHAVSRPSTSGSRSYDSSSFFGTPDQGRSPSIVVNQLSSSTSIPQYASGPSDEPTAHLHSVAGRADERSGGARRLGSPADLDDGAKVDSPLITAASGSFNAARSEQVLRANQSQPLNISASPRVPTDYGEVLRQSRRMRSDSRGSASIKSVASHVSSSSPVPLRTTSLKQEKGGVQSSPRLRQQRPDLVSSSSSYKSIAGSLPSEARSTLSHEEAQRSSQAPSRSWRQSSATLNAAAGPSGAGALAAIRASFGEPPELSNYVLSSDGKSFLPAVAGLRIDDSRYDTDEVATEDARGTTLSKLTGTSSVDDGDDEMEELRPADDQATSTGLAAQPLRPTKSPLRSRNPSSTASESGHGYRSVSAPMIDPRDQRSRPDGRPSQLLQQLSPPRKSLEEMGIADAVYRRGGSNVSSSGSFPRLAQSTSEASLRAGERKPSPPPTPQAPDASVAALRNRSASTLSLPATDEEAERDDHTDSSSRKTPKAATKRYKTLRKVTPPTIGKFSKNHGRQLSGPSALQGARTPSIAEDASSVPTPAAVNGQQRKKSIWRLGLGKDDSNEPPPLPTAASSASMSSSKSKLGMSIRGRKSEPPVPARPTIRRVFDVPGTNGSTGNTSFSGSEAAGDLTLSDAASTVTREHTLVSSVSRESLSRNSGNESPVVASSSMPGTPLTPSESLPAHLKQLMRRYNAIREMVETERSYATDLAVVRDVYLLRAKALAGIPLASPLQMPLSVQNTPILSPASLSGVPASAPAQSTHYSTSAKGTPPAQWSGRSVTHKVSSDAPLSSNSPVVGFSSSSASQAGGAFSGPWSNRSSTYTTSSHASSDVSLQWPPNPNSMPGTPSIGGASSTHKGSSGLAVTAAATTSPNPSSQLKSALPKIQTSASGSSPAVADPPLSASDIRIIFAYLEACCALSQDLSALLQAAVGSAMREHMTPTTSVAGSTPLFAENDDDRVGQTFLSIMSRIEAVFTAYCSRHEAGMQRLQLLNATSSKASAFLRECTEVARKQTTAWDLGSLLIKPVQRVLKYPLLLRQILNTTEASHPDHKHLTEALDQIQNVADKINQVKRRRDLADHIITGRDRDAKSATASPLSAAPSKSKRKMTLASRPPNTNIEMRLTDEALDAAVEQYSEIVKRFEALQSRVGIFGRQCGAWSYALRECYYAQLRIMACLRRVYSLRLPVEEEAVSSAARPAPVSPEDAIVAEYMNVLKTIINRSWRQMDSEVRTAILPMTAKLESMFEAPRLVIAKRDEREGDFIRCRSALQQQDGAAGKSLDRKALESADGFVALQEQLNDELPIFLQSVQILLDVGVQAFARLQAAHLDDVRNLTLDFWSDKAGHGDEVDMVGLDDDEMLNVGPTLRHINPVRAFWESHRPFAEWGDSLLIGRRESDLPSTVAAVDIDQALDSDLNDGQAVANSAPQPFSMSLLASMPSGSNSETPVFTSPFEQQPNSGKSNGLIGTRQPSPSSQFLSTSTRRPTGAGGVAGLMMRTLSGTFSRDNSPSPSAGGDSAPPMPDDAASTVRMHRETTVTGQRTLQPPPLSPLNDQHSDSSERTSVTASRSVSATAPTLPSLVFRDDDGADGSGGGDGFFIQSAPIAFLDTPEKVKTKELYGVSPSLQAVMNDRAVQPLPDLVAREQPHNGDLRENESADDDDDDENDGEHSPSSSFVSAESARSRLLRRSSAVATTALQQQQGVTDDAAAGAVAQNSALVESATQLPQRHKMQTLFRCVALQDAADPPGIERQDYMGWPYVAYRSGDTFRVVSTDAQAPTSSSSDVKLFGRLDRTGELGWVKKSHFSGMEDDTEATQ